MAVCLSGGLLGSTVSLAPVIAISAVICRPGSISVCSGPSPISLSGGTIGAVPLRQQRTSSVALMV